MMDELEKSTFAGKFTLSSNRETQGELKLAGPQSSLYLWDDDFIAVGRDEENRRQVKFIKGISNDLKKVSLINCLYLGSGRIDRHSPRRRTIYNARFLPGCAVFGDSHIPPDEKTITETSFVIEDEAAFFGDCNAFGVVANSPHSLVEQVVQSDLSSRDTRVGEDPVIAYYRGDNEIFVADTVLGTVSCWCGILYGELGAGRNGVKMEGRVSVHLKFDDAVAFDDALDGTFKVLRFFELLAPRPQNLMKFEIYKESGKEVPHVLQIYGSFFPRYERRENEQRPFSPDDVLIDAVRNPEEFSSVLEHWLREDDTWREPRRRFFNCFLKQERSIDRLIGAANAFEVLPKEAIPPEKKPSGDLRVALDRCKKILGKLLDEPDLNSVSSVFGRIGKNNLKKKVRHRAQLVAKEIGEDSLPEFSYVAGKAVDCRNHYVHGTSSRIDYEKEGTWVFLLETLEFIFAVSYLVEAGWKMKTRYEKNGGLERHPFGGYLNRYKANLGRLEYLDGKK